MQKMRITVTDDLDGTEGAETVRFGLDGDPYEIDLSAGNNARLKQAASLYITHARKVTPRPAAGQGGPRSTPISAPRAGQAPRPRINARPR